MKPYYKIGELSKIYDIGKDSLMYYEEIGLLHPIRGTNGYRLYSMTDIWRLNVIKELRALDVPMRRIKEYMDNRTLEVTEQMLEEELALIDAKVESLLLQRANIEKRLDGIALTKDLPIGCIKEQYFERREAVLIRANITTDAAVDMLMQQLQKEYAGKLDMIGSQKMGALFNVETFKGQKYDVFEAVFCIVDKGVGDISFEAGHYVTCTYKGSYKYNAMYIERMRDYLSEQGYEINGRPLELYLIDNHTTKQETEFITEIQIPFTKVNKGEN